MLLSQACLKSFGRFDNFVSSSRHLFSKQTTTNLGFCHIRELSIRISIRLPQCGHSFYYYTTRNHRTTNTRVFLDSAFQYSFSCAQRSLVYFIPPKEFFYSP